MSTIQSPRIVSREEWRDARKALEVKEKGLTRLRDQLAAERRALPWMKVEKEYVFDAPQGKVTLADRFDGRSQLFVKHFMMSPGQVGQCVGCSREVDHGEAPGRGRRSKGADDVEYHPVSPRAAGSA
jgi:predicted dithiol-disulfide oxidoreductase (DUF899 family)